MPLAVRHALLFVTTLAFTATSFPAATPQVLLHPDPQSRNCPLTLFAESRFTGGIALVPGQASARDRVGVHLHLEDPDRRAIRSVEVTLHGVPVSHGAQPAALGNSPQSASRTFHVIGNANVRGILDADLWLANVDSIRSVSVTAVEFAAAPRWTASSDSVCIAVPNGAHLVGSLR